MKKGNSIFLMTIPYLLVYLFVCVIIFLSSYFVNNIIYDDLGKSAVLLNQMSSYSCARIFLVWVFSFGFVKLLYKSNDFLKKEEHFDLNKIIISVVAIIVNIVFMLFPIISKLNNGSLPPWLENQYYLELANEFATLIFNILFVIMYKRKTISNLITKKRIVFEFIASFAFLFGLFIAIRNSILYVVDNFPHYDFILTSSNYMPQIDMLKIFISLIMYALISIEIVFICKKLISNYSFGHEDKKYIKGRINGFLILALLIFLIICFVPSVIDCTSRMISLRNNLIANNKRVEFSASIYEELEEFVLTQNEVDEFCNKAGTMCLIQWGEFIITTLISLGYIIYVNKSINKMVKLSD